jgi:hypothetical protein
MIVRRQLLVRSLGTKLTCTTVSPRLQPYRNTHKNNSRRTRHDMLGTRSRQLATTIWKPDVLGIKKCLQKHGGFRPLLMPQWRHIVNPVHDVCRGFLSCKGENNVYDLNTFEKLVKGLKDMKKSTYENILQRLQKAKIFLLKPWGESCRGLKIEPGQW